MKYIRDLKSRREFLQFVGRGSVLLYGSSLLAACAQQITKTVAPKSFEGGLNATAADAVTMVPGLTYNVVSRWQDPINGQDTFGFNNDFIALVKSPAGETFLWVNHESTDPKFVSQYQGGKKTAKQVDLERKSVGGSFIRVDKTAAGWKMVPDSRNFRLDGNTKIPFAWPKPIVGATFAVGTLANCAGGQTPWGTVLTCEENYHEFYGQTWIDTHNKRQIDLKTKYDWPEFTPQPPERYGWVVEISPWKKTAKKLVALGRFAHENACVVEGENGFPVVYMGDDAENEFIYKFISRKKDSLEEGELFVANSETGEWISMDWNKQPKLKKAFNSQTEVQIYCRQAARMLGATPQNRPEDIERDPRTGAIFISLTSNKKMGDYHGKIAKLEELEGATGIKFKLSTFLMGGKSNDFACPDNLVFDRKGNLWFTCDVSEDTIEKGEYVGFGNNGLYVVPISGADAGRPVRVAACPVDAEFTGPCFTEDFKTLFLSVQHPGSQSKGTAYTSHWPDGGTSMPRPSVIAISGETLEKFTLG